MDFLQPSAKAKDIVRELREAHRFFHWELEFPDVFQGTAPGFDAVIGNPPWEVQKPNSKEYFSDVDPLYRSYGKQEALDRQLEYFRNEARVELNWMHYSARLRARSNWVKYAAHPFGDQVWIDKDEKPHHEFPLDKKFGQSAADHKLWADLRKGRSGFADPAHPFLHQGSADLNTYKMFLETGHALLREGGRLGLLVPSGIYSDKGAGSRGSPPVGIMYSANIPAVVIRPILPPAYSVDHRAPSGPVVIPRGWLRTVVYEGGAFSGR